MHQVKFFTFTEESTAQARMCQFVTSEGNPMRDSQFLKKLLSDCT